MFTSTLIRSLFVLALASGAIAKPLPFSRRTDAPAPMSFNNWNGISSLNGFDNFYGADHFSGSSSAQIVVEQKTEVVCKSVQIEIIQQKLVVLQEMAKK